MSATEACAPLDQLAESLERATFYNEEIEATPTRLFEVAGIGAQSRPGRSGTPDHMPSSTPS